MPGVLFGPAMVGILIDHGDFSEEFAGWVMAFGSAGSALTLIVISGYIHQITFLAPNVLHNSSSASLVGIPESLVQESSISISMS